MEKRIYKYFVETSEEQSISLPKGAKILSIQSQKDTLRLWALIDIDEKEMQDYAIRIIGTGKPLPADIDNFKYFTTIEMCGGNLVWHIFIKN